MTPLRGKACDWPQSAVGRRKTRETYVLCTRVVFLVWQFLHGRLAADSCGGFARGLCSCGSFARGLRSCRGSFARGLCSCSSFAQGFVLVVAALHESFAGFFISGSFARGLCFCRGSVTVSLYPPPPPHPTPANPYVFRVKR